MPSLIVLGRVYRRSLSRSCERLVKKKHLVYQRSEPSTPVLWTIAGIGGAGFSRYPFSMNELSTACPSSVTSMHLLLQSLTAAFSVNVSYTERRFGSRHSSSVCRFHRGGSAILREEK